MKNFKKFLLIIGGALILNVPIIGYCVGDNSNLSQNPLAKYLLIGVGVAFICLILFIAYKLDSSSSSEKEVKAPKMKKIKIEKIKEVKEENESVDNEEENIDYTADIKKFDEYDNFNDEEESTNVDVPETPESFIDELKK